MNKDSALSSTNAIVRSITTPSPVSLRTIHASSESVMETIKMFEEYVTDNNSLKNNSR